MLQEPRRVLVSRLLTSFRRPTIHGKAHFEVVHFWLIDSGVVFHNVMNATHIAGAFADDHAWFLVVHRLYSHSSTNICTNVNGFDTAANVAGALVSALNLIANPLELRCPPPPW